MDWRTLFNGWLMESDRLEQAWEGTYALKWTSNIWCIQGPVVGGEKDETARTMIPIPTEGGL